MSPPTRTLRCPGTARPVSSAPSSQPSLDFALIWHIWWLAGLGVVGAYVTFVIFAWRDQDEYVIPADEVAKIDRANRSARSEALARLQAAQ